MPNPEKFKRMVEKAKLADENIQISFVILDLNPKWMKCRRTKRLVFQFHRLGDAENKTQCGKELEKFQILPDRQENLVITQVNMMLGGLGLLVFFDLCPDCFGDVNRCTPLNSK
jgi:hypothetical protein